MNIDNLSDEMLAAYLDGNATDSERALIENQGEEVSSLLDDVRLSTDYYFPDDFFIDPEAYYNPYLQAYPDTCAIKSQQLILNDFGIPCTEDQLVIYSAQHGWYDGHGTLVEDVGNLLEDAGIQCTRMYDANVFNLMDELARGHRVIVGVDSGELCGNRFHEWMEDFFYGEYPDHALLVTGIDTSDPDNIKVIVTDPGTGEVGKAYPLEQFMDAWSDASYFMCSTDVPAPPTAPGMENFDYISGHIPEVAGMEYAQFEMFVNMSMGLPVGVPSGAEGRMYYPIVDLVNAYHDVATEAVPVHEIFHDYGFNPYLDIDIVNQYMAESFHNGMEALSLDPSLSWDTYMAHNDISGAFSTDHYAEYLNGTIDTLHDCGDLHNAGILDQQHFLMEYCEGTNTDFHDTFFA